MLESFGVAPIVEQVYRALLQSPRFNSRDLADRLDCRPDEIWNAVQELARLTLMRPSCEDPQVLRAVPLKFGLEILQARQEADLLAQPRQPEQ
ncbi:hypothetical protein ACFYNO_35950 [Kitasatospora sp. NPDC006697]|uniref:hypothetical protein n=1 Tax=Kitasatospora sp. NPDC006697 TaxID=3364020 RepID=UPI0036A10B51